jgi:hypothetical protein
MSQNREDIDHTTIILELEKTKETQSVCRERNDKMLKVLKLTC